MSRDNALLVVIAGWSAVVLVASAALATAWRLNSQSPTEYCQYTCMVLDMDHAATEGCTCVCKDVDGSVHIEEVPDCP